MEILDLPLPTWNNNKRRRRNINNAVKACLRCSIALQGTSKRSLKHFLKDFIIKLRFYLHWDHQLFSFFIFLWGVFGVGNMCKCMCMRRGINKLWDRNDEKNRKRGKWLNLTVEFNTKEWKMGQMFMDRTVMWPQLHSGGI